MYENSQAEYSVIGCLLSEPTSIEKVYGMLSPDMFGIDILGQIYNESRKAFDDHKELTVTEMEKKLEATGYSDYEIDDAMRESLNTGAMPFQIVGHANVILSHYKKSVLDTILGRLEVKEACVDEQIENLIADLEDLRGGETSKGNTVAEIAEQYQDDYFKDHEGSLILLGMSEIDGMTGGLQGGDLVLCGARPSVGKSALATQWAEKLARDGLKVGYYNCEMQDRAMYERFIAAKSGIETTRLRLATRYLNDEEERYRRAVEELKKQENLIIFTGAKKVSEIRKDAREYKFGIIFVDYAQLLIPDNRYQGNRTSEVGQISRDLKNICMEMNIPIVALSQLNRASEGRANKRPTMADIRESGSLEQDASIIFLLWNSNEEDISEKTLEVCKSRNGKCGSVEMKYDGAHFRFTPVSELTPFDGR